MLSIDKTRLLKQICHQLETDLKSAKEAALATYQAATDEESKAENEYDTRGLEASYLAGAQAKRVKEIEEQLALYRYLEMKSFTEDHPISSTALVEVDLNGKKTLVFMMPKGGGLSVNFEGHPIQIVTPTSPLGESLVGLKVGDVATIDAHGNTKEYEILNIV